MVISSCFNLGLQNFYFLVPIEFLNLKKNRDLSNRKINVCKFKMGKLRKIHKAATLKSETIQHFSGRQKKYQETCVEVADRRTFHLRTVFQTAIRKTEVP